MAIATRRSGAAANGSGARHSVARADRCFRGPIAASFAIACCSDTSSPRPAASGPHGVGRDHRGASLVTLRGRRARHAAASAARRAARPDTDLPRQGAGAVRGGAAHRAAQRPAGQACSAPSETGHEDDARRMRTVIELVLALSVHDRASRGHSERVRVFTDLLADELKVPESGRNRLRWAALLHDIGKLEVPPRDPQQAGQARATEEWAVLHRHPEEGARLVAPLLPWLGEWGLAVVQHHERFDGTGYPHGSGARDLAGRAHRRRGRHLRGDDRAAPVQAADERGGRPPASWCAWPAPSSTRPSCAPSSTSRSAASGGRSASAPGSPRSRSSAASSAWGLGRFGHGDGHRFGRHGHGARGRRRGGTWTRCGSRPCLCTSCHDHHAHTRPAATATVRPALATTAPTATPSAKPLAPTATPAQLQPPPPGADSQAHRRPDAEADDARPDGHARAHPTADADPDSHPEAQPVPTPDPWSCAGCTNTAAGCVSYCGSNNNVACINWCTVITTLYVRRTVSGTTTGAVSPTARARTTRCARPTAAPPRCWRSHQPETACECCSTSSSSRPAAVLPHEQPDVSLKPIPALRQPWRGKNVRELFVSRPAAAMLVPQLCHVTSNPGPDWRLVVSRSGRRQELVAERR